MDSFMLTLGSVAGLSVATFHCGGHGVAATLMHGVQVPLPVRADHLPVSRAGATAPRALREDKQRYLGGESDQISKQVPLCPHQAPVSNMPRHVCGAGRHFTSLDRMWTQQIVAGQLVYFHSSWINTSDFSGLFTRPASDRALQTQGIVFNSTFRSHRYAAQIEFSNMKNNYLQCTSNDIKWNQWSVWYFITHRAPTSYTILWTLVHVARLQRGRSLSIGGTNGILNDARASGIVGDALHCAHLRASTAGNRAGVPLTSCPAGEKTRADRRSQGLWQTKTHISTVK